MRSVASMAARLADDNGIVDRIYKNTVGQH
jgi:hypothetical protein